MRFRDLGPLTVEIDGVERVFSGTRQAAILAMLVLHANAWVSKDRLAAAGWGIDVTVTAASVENQVSRLRRVLSQAWCEGESMTLGDVAHLRNLG